MSKILVIDDSAFSRKIARTALEKLGHTVEEAHDGNAGFEKATSNSYDCVLTDLLMPGLTGLELLEKMQGHSCPVIVVTADIQSTTREKCQQLGAQAIVNKPLDDQKLRQALETVSPSLVGNVSC